MELIRLKFDIGLPIDRWGTIRSFSGDTPFSYKYWEFNIDRCSQIISFDFSWKIRTDHAGFEIWVGLFGYALQYLFYDDRHWDNKKGCWETYDE